MKITLETPSIRKKTETMGGEETQDINNDLENVENHIKASLELIEANPNLLKHMGISDKFESQLQNLRRFIEDPSKTENMKPETLAKIKEGTSSIHNAFVLFTKSKDNKQEAKSQIREAVENIKDAIKEQRIKNTIKSWGKRIAILDTKKEKKGSEIDVDAKFKEMISKKLEGKTKDELGKILGRYEYSNFSDRELNPDQKKALTLFRIVVIDKIKEIDLKNTIEQQLANIINKMNDKSHETAKQQLEKIERLISSIEKIDPKENSTNNFYHESIRYLSEGNLLHTFYTQVKNIPSTEESLIDDLKTLIEKGGQSRTRDNLANELSDILKKHNISIKENNVDLKTEEVLNELRNVCKDFLRSDNTDNAEYKDTLERVMNNAENIITYYIEYDERIQKKRQKLEGILKTAQKDHV